MSRVVDIIEKKRDGKELSRGEIERLVLGYVRGEVPDYQVAAWLMAICWRGMTPRETADLTSAMVDSGARLDLSSVPWPAVDKHSSGGVGDKTSLVVAPLVRACGAAVGKMSGRGLGFTGGTIDKLESIPGYRVDLSPDEFLQQLTREGIVLSGQTPELAPADGKLYALRDVTATVPSLPLIASSIMSKKLAIGARGLVLDVKHGSGAFMSSAKEARALAKQMVDIGKAAGRRVTALLTPMDEPLGSAVGNALEVAEAIETLRGNGPEDLVRVSLALAGEMLFLAGLAETPSLGEAAARRALASDEGLRWLRRLVSAQGGDERVVDEPVLMGTAPVIREVRSQRAGWVERVDARAIASVALGLGAGRAVKGDPVDHQVGVALRAKTASRVAAGDILAVVHARDEAAADLAAPQILAAYTFADGAVPSPDHKFERITSQ